MLEVFWLLRINNALLFYFFLNAICDFCFKFTEAKRGESDKTTLGQRGICLYFLHRLELVFWHTWFFNAQIWLKSAYK